MFLETTNGPTAGANPKEPPHTAPVPASPGREMAKNCDFGECHSTSLKSLTNALMPYLFLCDDESSNDEDQTCNCGVVEVWRTAVGRRVTNKRRASFWALILLCCNVCQFSCTRSSRHQNNDKVPLVHVTGTVLVDGVPTAGVHIQYVPQSEIAERRERYLNRFFLLSREGGKFSLSTYVDGDGIPIGEYALEFKWIEQRLSGEIDKLGGVYADSSSPFLKIKVEKGRDINLGEIQLTSKNRGQR